MSSATLSIQDVGGFPVLVCPSAERREVYPVQNPMTPIPGPELTINVNPCDSIFQNMRRLLGGEE